MPVSPFIRIDRSKASFRKADDAGVYFSSSFMKLREVLSLLVFQIFVSLLALHQSKKSLVHANQ